MSFVYKIVYACHVFLCVFVSASAFLQTQTNYKQLSLIGVIPPICLQDKSNPYLVKKSI